MLPEIIAVPQEPQAKSNHPNPAGNKAEPRVPSFARRSANQNLKLQKPIPMKPSPSLFESYHHEADCRQLHANVSKLPVYQFERLAFTDVANIPAVNESAVAQERPSLRKSVWRVLHTLF